MIANVLLLVMSHLIDLSTSKSECNGKQTDLLLLIQLLRFFNLRDYKWSIGPILKISGSHKHYQNKVTMGWKPL